VPCGGSAGLYSAALARDLVCSAIAEVPPVLISVRERDSRQVPMETSVHGHVQSVLCDVAASKLATQWNRFSLHLQLTSSPSLACTPAAAGEHTLTSGSVLLNVHQRTHERPRLAAKSLRFRTAS
jgi:hypothetical protein